MSTKYRPNDHLMNSLLSRQTDYHGDFSRILWPDVVLLDSFRLKLVGWMGSHQWSHLSNNNNKFTLEQNDGDLYGQGQESLFNPFVWLESPFWKSHKEPLDLGGPDKKVTTCGWSSSQLFTGCSFPKEINSNANRNYVPGGLFKNGFFTICHGMFLLNTSIHASILST